MIARLRRPSSPRSSVLLRHRTFLARLRRGRVARPRIAPVPRVLQRPRARPAAQRLTVVQLFCSDTHNAFTRALIVRGATRRELAIHSLHSERTRVVESRRDRHVRVIERHFAHAAAIPSERARQPARPAVIVQHVPRAPMTVARPLAAVNGLPLEPEAPRRSRDRETFAARAETFKSAERPAALPPAELSRIADHVMQQLDRRVLSYRERTGRL